MALGSQLARRFGDTAFCSGTYGSSLRLDSQIRTLADRRSPLLAETGGYGLIRSDSDHRPLAGRGAIDAS
jgi:hypothetical protein